MPKVLITNDSNSATWYHGKKGQLFDFTHTRHGHYFVEGFDNDGPAGVHIPDGRIIYTESEYEELLQQRNKAIDDLAKHAQTIVDLQNEKLRLQQEADHARDEQKVELPREVAEAIDYLGTRFSRRNILALILEGIVRRDRIDYDRKRNNAVLVLKEHEFDDILQALTNGYTIQLEPRDKVKQFIEKWYTSPCGDDPDAELYELSDGIIELLQKSS